MLPLVAVISAHSLMLKEQIIGLTVSFGGKAVLGGPKGLEQNQECKGGKPGAQESSGVGPNSQPMLPRPLHPALCAALSIGCGWWSGRSLVLGHTIGHAVGRLGSFIGTILRPLGLPNLYVPGPP